MIKSFMYDTLNSADLEQIGWADAATKSVPLVVINFEAAHERATQDLRRRISENRKSEAAKAANIEGDRQGRAAGAGAD